MVRQAFVGRLLLLALAAGLFLFVTLSSHVVTNTGAVVAVVVVAAVVMSVFGLIGYMRVIPSVKAIARDDEALAARGCRWSLPRALQMRPGAKG